jgi:hypothetical protein
VRVHKVRKAAGQRIEKRGDQRDTAMETNRHRWGPIPQGRATHCNRVAIILTTVRMSTRRSFYLCLIKSRSTAWPCGSKPLEWSPATFQPTA